MVAADLAGRIVDRELRGLERAAAGDRSLGVAIDELSHRLGAIPRRAMGIGVAALIDRRGHLVFGPNLGWSDVPLAEIATAILPLPVLVENDTNAAAIAEREFGCCAEVDDFICLSGHSGSRRRDLRRRRALSRRGRAGGRIRPYPYRAGREACGCGARGCLEAYASIPALIGILAERDRPGADIGEMAMRAEAGDTACCGSWRKRAT